VRVEENMSVFVNISRYDKGKFVMITEAELKAAVKKLPGYGIIRDTESGAVGVTLPQMEMIAELEDTGILSCPYDLAPNGEKLIKVLKKLAAKIPGAVVEDEDENPC
jgi:hypothetical protein